MREIDENDCSEHDDYFQFTGRARLSRDMHILEGYIQGIAADSKIEDTELRQLIRWLSEHKEFANRHPFSEVIPRIQKIITEGIADEGERADILWLSNKFTTNDEYYDDLTSDLQRLQGMLAGILSDGRITEEELVGLDRWISERSHLRHCWPYDHLAGIVELVMRDGRIDAQEHEAILQLFSEFVRDSERRAVGALEPGVTVSGVCCASPSVCFETRCFCFTGKSTRATKDELAQIVVHLGGSFHKELRKDTNCLIVGADGNPCWAFACYGRKVEDAVSRRRDGQDISVVQEFDFWQAVENIPASAACIELSKNPKPSIQKRESSKPVERLNRIPAKPACTPRGSQLAGKTLVVTGTLSKYKREEIEALITQHGGRAGSSISKKTDYLVAGDKAGSKLEKANKLGVAVISEAEFDRLIGNH